MPLNWVCNLQFRKNMARNDEALRHYCMNRVTKIEESSMYIWVLFDEISIIRQHLTSKIHTCSTVTKNRARPQSLAPCLFKYWVLMANWKASRAQAQCDPPFLPSLSNIVNIKHTTGWAGEIPQWLMCLRTEVWNPRPHVKLDQCGGLPTFLAFGG